MYGSRKVKVKFAKSTWDDQLKGIGFAPGAFDRDEQSERSPVAPPSPLPPSPAPPSPQAADFGENMMGQMKEDEFTRHAREQTKAQLESITGRMFQVLNDFEGDGSNEEGYIDIDDQVNSIQNTQLKANIQLMIADYKDMCVEREELLHSLADWFDEGHIDDIIEDVKHRRTSVVADPEGLRKSLLEGKKASQKLKSINDQIEHAKDQGLPVSHLEEKRAELEKEVMKSAKFMENDKKELPQEDVSTKVKDSWKFAAVEIYNLINQVRENGLDDVHEMESKMRELLSSMNQQSEIIDKLSNDLQHQRQIAAFSDMTTSQLSGDNSLLKDEVEMLRGQLMDANDTIISLRSDIRLKTKETEEKKGKAKQSVSARDKRILDTEMAKLELKVTQLTEENTNLQQENQELLVVCERLERDLEVAKELFDDEVAGHKAELEMLTSTMEEHQSMSEQVNVSVTNVILGTSNESLNTSTSTHSKPTTESPGSSHEVTRRVSAKSKTVTAMAAKRRVSQFHHTFHHSQDHMFAKLADKEHQLKSAKQELMETRNLVQSMENELEKLKRENAELVKLQERSAALIKQASTCLQMQSERSTDTTSQQSVRVPQPSSDQPHYPPSISVIQSTMNTETVHKITQSSLTASTSISHSNGHSTKSTVDESPRQTSAATEKPSKKSGANIWSVVNSVDDGSSVFGMPPERSAKEKKADSLQLVMELIEKVNTHQSDFATADSGALKQIHTELSKVSQLVRNFLEYSTSLINDEAEVVSHAVDSLMEQLPNEDKPELDGPMPPPGEKPNRLQQQRLSLADTSLEEQTRLKEKAVHFADQAIEVLKAGERMLTTKINTQQKRLHTVLHAMEDHRRRQSQFFKFEAPDAVGLVLQAHGVSKHNIASNQQKQQTQQKEQSTESNRERLERLRRYTMTGRMNANANLFVAYMKAGRFSNNFTGLGGAFQNMAEDSDDVEGMGINMGIHGYGGHGRNTTRDVGQPTNSPQINTNRQEGKVSLQFGNVGNYQRYQPTREATDVMAGSKPRKKAGRLYKPFLSSTGNSNMSPRKEHLQSRQGVQPGGQRMVNSNVPQMGRRWESSAYNQQEYKIQDTGSRNHKTSGATFYDLIKHNTRAARTRQQTVTLLGDSTGVKLPPI